MKKRLIVVAVLCFSLIIAGCGALGANKKYVRAEQEDAVFQIDTSFAALKYPAKWEQHLRTEENGPAVAFYGVFDGHDDVLLYTLLFGEEQGYHLGTLGETEVYILDVEVEFDESWNNAEKSMVYDMQEAVNVTLQNLAETGNFVYATGP